MYIARPSQEPRNRELLRHMCTTIELSSTQLLTDSMAHQMFLSKNRPPSADARPETDKKFFIVIDHGDMYKATHYQGWIDVHFGSTGKIYVVSAKSLSRLNVVQSVVDSYWFDMADWHQVLILLMCYGSQVRGMVNNFSTDDYPASLMAGQL